MKKYIFPSLLLMATVWFLYFQTGSFEFLRLDDHDYTFRCAFVREGLSWANITEAFSNARHAAIWMPITYLTYMADISLFGPGMGPHHLVNVAIHSLNAVLFYWLLLALCASGWSARSADPTNLGTLGRDRTPCGPHALIPALLAAAFWALHPQRVEAVAWIAGRKELLCAFFTLLGLLVWVRGRGAARLVGGWVCCTLACMSKPTGMCFPFLAFAVEWMGMHGEPRFPKPFRKVVLSYSPLLALAMATGALAIYSQTHPEGRPELALFSASLPWRLLNAAVAVGLYLFQAIVPVRIHLDYRATPGDCPLHTGLGLATLAIAIGLLVAFCRRKRGTVPLLLFFFAALVPTLGIFGSFGEHARADRFFYLPAMVLSMALVGTALRAVRAHESANNAPDGRHGVPTLPRFALSMTGLSLLGGLGVLVVFCASFPVVASYRNDFTAFSRTLQFDSDNGRALAHVASEECARFGHIDKGITLYRRSQELRPRDDTAAQLAYTLALRGLSSDYAEIRRLCAKFACDHSLDHKGMALEALSTTAMRQRRWDEAISCLTDSIKAPARFYSAEDAKLRLGACYCNAKRPEDAIRIFEPLTQSRRTDISSQARQFLRMIKKNPNSILFF